MSYNYSGSRREGTVRKQYAVVIYLPEQLERFVAPLRERYDPDYDLITAHITLVFPWETTVPLSELTAVLATETLRLSPIEIELNSVGDFYPDTPIIYWQVAPNGDLNRLYRNLYSQLGLTLPFNDIIPHVTVAKEISPHRVVLVKDQIASYLPHESFEATALDLVSPLADNKWVSVRTFPLAAVLPDQE